MRAATVAPFTLLGLALPIFLGFRNNACYGRWWEGRRQCGQLVAETRGLVRDLVTLLADDPVLQRRCAHRAVIFAHALCSQRRSGAYPRAQDWLTPAEWSRIASPRSQPDAILLVRRDRA